MTDALSLRPYRPADRERVLDLHETALRDAGALLGDDGGQGEAADRDGGRDLHPDYEADLLDLAGSYRDPEDATFLVGTVDGRIVSMGGVRPVGGHLADLLAPFEADRAPGELKRLRVDPAHQRRGHGRRTLAALEDRARELGYPALVLDTTPVQEAAVGLFEAAGYDLVRRERVTAAEESFTLLCYRRELA